MTPDLCWSGWRESNGICVLVFLVHFYFEVVTGPFKNYPALRCWDVQDGMCMVSIMNKPVDPGP